MKNSIFLRSLLPFVGMLMASLSLGADTDCGKCDCSHFPISDADCVTCCFSEKITVTSSTDTSVTGKPALRDQNQGEKTFQIRKGTRINGKLQSGTTTTVYYHVSNGERVATRIDEMAALRGALAPANSPSPQDTCEDLAAGLRARGVPVPSVPPDALKIFFGDSEAYSTEQRFIVLKVGDEETMVLQRTESGMFVSLKVRGPDGKLLADIVDNEFFVNLDQARIERPGPSSLVMYDSHRQRVLDIEFLSPR